MSRQQLILEQAADWYARLRADAAGEAERQGWRDWLSADPDHARAWQRIENVLAPFQTAGGAAALATGTLSKARTVGRRRALQALGFGGLAIGAGVLFRGLSRENESPPMAMAPPAWRTEVGQQRRLTLPDGTGLALNTASAVDIDFSASLRRIVLHAGELMVTAASQAGPSIRELVVDTRHGRIATLGSRFDVRSDEREAQVAVFSGAVHIAPTGDGARPTDVGSGRLSRFSSHGIDTIAKVQAWRESWTRGLLVVDDASLGDFVLELGRYSLHAIGIDAAAARLRLIGVYPIASPSRDLPAILAELAQALPVRVDSTRGGGWFIRAR